MSKFELIEDVLTQCQKYPNAGLHLEILFALPEEKQIERICTLTAPVVQNIVQRLPCQDLFQMMMREMPTDHSAPVTYMQIYYEEMRPRLLSGGMNLSCLEYCFLIPVLQKQFIMLMDEIPTCIPVIQSTLHYIIHERPRSLYHVQ